jgi:hypothetical protein
MKLKAPEINTRENCGLLLIASAKSECRRSGKNSWTGLPMHIGLVRSLIRARMD